MTILDSNIFGSAGGGGGGSMARKYVSGMVVENLDEVRSVFDSQVYIRCSDTPKFLTITKDPALDFANFVSDDNANPVGTVASLSDDVDDENPVKWLGNQGWLRSGNLLPVETLSRKIPKDLELPFSLLESRSGTFNNSPIPGMITNYNYSVAMATDDEGNWLVIVSNGYTTGAYPNIILKSTDDGVTWTKVTSASANVIPAMCKIATNKTGRWWVHSGMSQPGNMFYSDDLGATWNVTTSPTETTPPGILKVVNGELYYVPNTAIILADNAATTITVYYKCSNPTAGVLTWTPVLIDRAIVKAAGHTAGHSFTIQTIDVLPNGSVWMTATNISQPSYVIAVMFYDVLTSVWTCVTQPYKDKITKVGANILHVIGTMLEGSDLRLCYGSNTGLYEAIFNKNNDLYVYEITKWARPAPEIYTVWNTFSSASQNHNSYYRVGNRRFISWNGSYTTTQGGTQTSSYAHVVLDGKNSIRPITKGIQNGLYFNSGTYSSARASNGTTLFGILYVPVNGIARSVPTVGLLASKSDGVGVGDFLRIQ